MGHFVAVDAHSQVDEVSGSGLFARGRDATTTCLVDSKLCCPCGSSWTLLCVNCKRELRFDARLEALRCACGMSFRFVLG